MNEKLNQFIRALRNRNYSERTIDIYGGYIARFLDFADRSQYSPEERIPAFLDECHGAEERRLGYYAIKLFYRVVISKECPYALDRIRKRKRLPRVLDRDEVLRILDAIPNPKHYQMISFLYGSGLRVSEVTRIRICDLDLDNLRLYILNAKGQKDRMTLISSMQVQPLGNLVRGRRPQEFLFLSRHGKPYPVRTVQKIFNDAYLKSGVKKKASCHTFRHCFATHLLESGADIKSIKQLLGHKSLKTTSIYLHLADMLHRDIISPL